MAEYNLVNETSVAGMMGAKALAMDSIPVATLMTDELSIEKEADRDVWVTGELTYTITVENTSGVAYTDAVLTDTLDAAITLVEGSVKINGSIAVKDTDYTFVGRVLTVYLPDIPAATGKAIVMFRVSKV